MQFKYNLFKLKMIKIMNLPFYPSNNQQVCMCMKIIFYKGIDIDTNFARVIIYFDTFMRVYEQKKPLD